MQRPTRETRSGSSRFNSFTKKSSFDSDLMHFSHSEVSLCKTTTCPLPNSNPAIGKTGKRSEARLLANFLHLADLVGPATRTKCL